MGKTPQIDSGSSHTLGWKLGNLLGTQLDPLNLGDRIVAGALAVGAELILGTLTGFLEPAPYGIIPYLDCS